MQQNVDQNLKSRSSGDSSPRVRPQKVALKYHPLSFIRMIWKHKALALWGWIFLGAVGVVLVSQLPDVYRADSLILVDSQKIPERFVTSTVEVPMEEHLATISQQILSTTQLEKLIDKFNLYPKLRKRFSPEQIIEQMRADVQILPEKGWGARRDGKPSTGAFRVAYEGPNAVIVAGVVNEISGLFVAENLRARERRAEGTSEFIESQLQEARKSLEKQEANLSRFKMERMGELPEQETALIGTLARLHSELQGNQDSINRAEQNKVMLESTLRLAETAEAAVTRNLEQASKPERPQTVIYSNPDVTERVAHTATPVLRSQTLRSQIEGLRLRYHDEHPEIRRLKLELDIAMKQEERELAAAPPPEPKKSPSTASKAPSVPSAAETAAATSPAAVQLLGELNRERGRVAATKTQLAYSQKEMGDRVAERQRILKDIAVYQSKVERLPMREQELASVTRDYEISKTNYKSLLDKKLSAEMASDMEKRQQSEQFTVQDPARIPGAPIKPKRMIFNLGAIGVGLVLSLVWVVGIELKRNTFLGEWELPQNVAVLGRVPTITINTYPAKAVLSASHVEGSASHV